MFCLVSILVGTLFVMTHTSNIDKDFGNENILKNIIRSFFIGAVIVGIVYVCGKELGVKPIYPSSLQKSIYE